MFANIGPSQICTPISVHSKWEQGQPIQIVTPTFTVAAPVAPVAPVTSVTPVTPVTSAFANSKNNLLSDLTNEKQLYKKFGFSRKKTLTLEQLQHDLEHEIPTIHVLTYISKWFEVGVLYPDNKSALYVPCDTSNQVHVVVLTASKLILHEVVPREGLKEYVEKAWPTVSNRKKMI